MDWLGCKHTTDGLTFPSGTTVGEMTLVARGWTDDGKYWTGSVWSAGTPAALVSGTGTTFDAEQEIWVDDVGTVLVAPDAYMVQLTCGSSDDTLFGYTSFVNLNTGDAYARLGAPAGASVSADIAAVKAETVLIVADTGTDGVVLANDAITAAVIATDAIGSSEIAAGAIGSSEAPNLNTTVSSRLAATAAPTNFGDMSIAVTTGLVDITQAAADKVWGTTTRELTGAANITDDGGVIDVTAGAIDNVTLNATTTTNTDMVGTNDAATATALALVQADTDDIQGRLPVALVNGLMSSDVTAVSTDTTSADNLELQYDGTGISGDTFPSTQSQLGGIANVGSAIHRPASSYTLTTGTQSANTYTATEALDGTRHEHTDDAGAMELYYEFDIGAGIPSSTQITGYIFNNNDSVGVFGYDWVAAGWVQIGTLDGSGASNNVNSYDMFVDMVGTGANLGTARVQLLAASGLTSATLAIDQIFIAFSQGADAYWRSSVWYADSASNTGTSPGIDGTGGNPVSSEAAVQTLLASTGYSSVSILPGSTYTMAAAHDDNLIYAHGGTIALGGQSVDNLHVFGGMISGTGTAATNMKVHDATVGTASVQNFSAVDTSFTSTLTMTLAGDYSFIDSTSGVAGAGAPTFTKTAGQTITAEWRRWSGSITISGLESGDVITVGGEMGTITLNGADGTVEVRGTYKAIVDNRTGSPTLNIDGAMLAADLAAIKVDTGTDIPATIATLQADSDINTGTTGVLLDSTATSAQLISDLWDELCTGASHNIPNSACRILREIREVGQYAGFIHIDTVNGTAGDVDYENGTISLPVDNITDAMTISASLGIMQFSIKVGSSITLGATTNGYLFQGEGEWALILGGQDVGGTEFIRADVSGTSTGTMAHYHHGQFGTATLSNAHIEFAELNGTITFSAPGDNVIANSHSGIAGAGTPIIDMGAAVGSTNLSMPGYKNGIEIRNLNNAGTDLFSIAGVGQIIYAASSSGAVNQRGDWKVTNTGGVTITADDNTTGIAAIEVDTTEIGIAGAGLDDLGGMSTAMKAEINTEADQALTDYDGPTNTEMVAAFTEIKGAGWSSSTDTLEDIIDTGNASWVTGAGGAPPDLLQATTIATLADQATFTLTAGSADDNAYNDATVVFTDAVTAEQKAVGKVDTYTGSTLGVVLVADPAIFTLAVGDFVDIIVAPAATVAGTVDANIVQVVGDAQSAVDFKDFADAGYDPATDKVQGVVLTDVATTVTDGAKASVATEARLAELDAGNLPADVAAVKAETALIYADTTAGGPGPWTSDRAIYTGTCETPGSGTALCVDSDVLNIGTASSLKGMCFRVTSVTGEGEWHSIYSHDAGAGSVSFYAANDFTNDLDSATYEITAAGACR